MTSKTKKMIFFGVLLAVYLATFIGRTLHPSAPKIPKEAHATTAAVEKSLDATPVNP